MAAGEQTGAEMRWKEDTHENIGDYIEIHSQMLTNYETNMFGL